VYGRSPIEVRHALIWLSTACAAGVLPGTGGGAGFVVVGFGAGLVGVGDAEAVAAGLPGSVLDGTGASWVADDGAEPAPSADTVAVLGDEQPASNARNRTTISGAAVREEATGPLLTLDSGTRPSY
jgi:hypothetical protein